ncbi:MAG: hypothetical protein ABIS86_19925 [Streptosporangiaceae bacterium]
MVEGADGTEQGSAQDRPRWVTPTVVGGIVWMVALLGYCAYLTTGISQWVAAGTTLVVAAAAVVGQRRLPQLGHRHWKQIAVWLVIVDSVVTTGLIGWTMVQEYRAVDVTVRIGLEHAEGLAADPTQGPAVLRLDPVNHDRRYLQVEFKVTDNDPASGSCGSSAKLQATLWVSGNPRDAVPVRHGEPTPVQLPPGLRSIELHVKVTKADMNCLVDLSVVSAKLTDKGNS